MRLRIAGKFLTILNSEIVKTAKNEWSEIQKEIIVEAIQRDFKNPVRYLLRKFRKEIENQGRWLAYANLYAYIEGQHTALRFERFRDRIGITKGQYRRLWKAFRHKFFWLSLINDVKVIEKVKEQIDEAIEEGIPQREFIREYIENIQDKWYYAETVFRTNLTSHYNLGIMDGYDTEYFEYSAIIDERTTEICERLNGRIITRNDTHLIPPNHYNCRSILVPTNVPIGKPVDFDVVKEFPEWADFLHRIELVEIPPSVWNTIKDYVSRDEIEEVNRKLRELLE